MYAIIHMKFKKGDDRLRRGEIEVVLQAEPRYLVNPAHTIKCQPHLRTRYGPGRLGGLFHS